MAFTWLTCFHSPENGPKRLECWQQAVSNESEPPSGEDPSQYTHISRFELVDDGCFAAVVKPQAQKVDLLLPQAEPGWQFIQQPHWTPTDLHRRSLNASPHRSAHGLLSNTRGVLISQTRCPTQLWTVYTGVAVSGATGWGGWLCDR